VPLASRPEEQPSTPVATTITENKKALYNGLSFIKKLDH
jgi:hypothetical protein